MRRSFLAVAVLAAIVPLAACERADPGPSPTVSTVPSGAPSPSPTFSAEGYLYTSKEGLRALATFGGDTPSLEIENATGAPLAAPGLYVLDARTGEVIEVAVSPRRGVRDGVRREFTLRPDRDVAPGQIGLVVLTIGGEDRGAFLPPAPEEEAG